jgi:diadenosine tetraphosphate (Ap4A) HIT family hydrolase
VNRTEDSCPFCREIAASSAQGDAVVLSDANPVSDGHMLIVPRRHVGRVEELEDAEWDVLFAEVRAATRSAVAAAANGVDGVNIGVNSGAAAGQTVAHAHVHVIPRRHGDCEDPRGGVRWVVGGRNAAYWEQSSASS